MQAKNGVTTWEYCIAIDPANLTGSCMNPQKIRSSKILVRPVEKHLLLAWAYQ